MSPILVLVLSGLIASSVARCNCTADGFSSDSVSSNVLVILAQYATAECEAACCTYPGGLCVGYGRLTVILEGKRLGDCVLYRSPLSLAPSPGFTLVSIGSGSVTCEVTNILYQKAGVVLSTLSSMSAASCQALCCVQMNCVAYGFDQLAFASGSVGPCILYSSMSPVVASNNLLMVDLSGCARQPTLPAALKCSTGDQVSDNAAEGATISLCNGASCSAVSQATDGDLSTSINAGENFNDGIFIDLLSQRLVGFVTIYAALGSTAQAHLITSGLYTAGSYPNEGLIVMVGDSLQCASSLYPDTIPACPVCARIVDLEPSKVYKVDCRGMRGRYVVIFAPRDDAPRILDIAEVAVLPAPFFPESSAYVLGAGQICCNDNAPPVPVDESHWLAPNPLVLSVTTNQPAAFAPFLLVSLGGVSMPVGVVLVDFPSTLSIAGGMFAGLDTLYTDAEFPGFVVGVTNVLCVANQPCGGNICGTISRVSYGGEHIDAISGYRVDCKGLAGAYVFVQLVTRSGAFVFAPTLTVRNLQVFPPSRIAPAIYPARSELGSVFVTSTTTSSEQAVHPWRQEDLAQPSAVGIVKIVTACFSRLLMQPFSLAELQTWVSTGTELTLRCEAGSGTDEWHGLDNGAIVGVSDTPCSDTEGCGGTVCEIISQAPQSYTASQSATVHVDCRGVIGRYIYVLLPQPQINIINQNLGGLPPLPRRTVSFFATAHEFQTIHEQTIKPVGRLLGTFTAPSASACETMCLANSLCHSWRFLSACDLYLDFNARTDIDPAAGTGVGGHVCKTQLLSDSLQCPNPPYTSTWRIFPPKSYVLTTRAPSPDPTRAPSPAPTRAPSPAPTSVPSPAPTNLPTRAPSSTPTRSPTHVPTSLPTRSPTSAPSTTPTHFPTLSPSTTFPTRPGETSAPTTLAPSSMPITRLPSTATPTQSPSSLAHSYFPTRSPSYSPTRSPTAYSQSPTRSPTATPTPIPNPTLAPTTRGPTAEPTGVTCVEPAYVGLPDNCVCGKGYSGTVEYVGNAAQGCALTTFAPTGIPTSPTTNVVSGGYQDLPLLSGAVAWLLLQ